MPTKSFSYLPQNTYYFDSACQSLRPKSVIDAELSYYTTSNACGGRGNYEWANNVDDVIEETRNKILQFVNKPKDEYAVVFTPNATYAINLLMQNIKTSRISQVITTHKEHNSVLLPAIQWAKYNNRGLVLLEREGQQLDITPCLNAIQAVLLMAVNSNIDGEEALRFREASKAVKQNNGYVILDACQSLSHAPFSFKDTPFDALIGSAHKLYAPSLGFMVMSRAFIRELESKWIGGGTIQSLENLEIELIDSQSHLHERLELGLLDYAAIFGLGESLRWIESFEPSVEIENFDWISHIYSRFEGRYGQTPKRKKVLGYMNLLSDYLFNSLLEFSNNKDIMLINQNPSSIISFVPLRRSAHTITEELSKSGIMCRSGYLCAHHYIKEKLKSPQVVRVSLGLHNTIEDISFLLEKLKELL